MILGDSALNELLENHKRSTIQALYQLALKIKRISAAAFFESINHLK